MCEITHSLRNNDNDTENLNFTEPWQFGCPKKEEKNFPGREMEMRISKRY